MKKLSIKLRMTIWYTTLMLLIVAVTLALLYIVSNKVSDDGIQDNLKSIVKTVEDEIDSNNSLVTEEDLQSTIDNVFVAVYSSYGELIAGISPDGYVGEPAFDNKETHTIIINNHQYYIYDKKGDNVKGYDNIWVRGFISVENSEDKMESLTKAACILLPVLILLIAAGGYFVAKRAFIPLEKMNQAAGEISEGNDLSKRIPLCENQDEIYKMGVKMNEMLERLEKSFQNEKQFTSDASHELRTPISVILSQCDFSLENTKSQEDYVEALEVIERQARKMAKLIQELLTFSRMDRMDTKKEFENINISELVEIICEEQKEIHDDSISISTEIKSGILVSANQSLLARAYINLISNAYQYGKEKGHIWVRLFRDGAKIVFLVQDDGIGISEENQAKIWKRFYRADESRTKNESGSMGLGLAMVKWIAEYHEGTVSVESKLSEGSTFRFEFTEKRTHLMLL